MPTARETGNRGFTAMGLPYVTFDSPLSDLMAYEKGKNVMTSVKNVLERRPGFSQPLEKVPTVFPGIIRNVYFWQRPAGSYYCMVSHDNNGDMEVYKLQIGTDDSFVRMIIATGVRVPFDFWARGDYCYMGCGVAGYNYKYNGDGVAYSFWGIEPPRVKAFVTLSDGGGLTAEVDYHWGYTYYDERNGHESSMSDITDCLQTFTNKFADLTAYEPDTDPQPTHIRYYRTRDGGSTDPQEMQEIFNSPLRIQPPFSGNNLPSGAVIPSQRDNADDADLQNRFGPGIDANNPPPPLFAITSSGGRMYGVRGDKPTEVWYSGNDEITHGMPEQCFPGAPKHRGDLADVDGNFYPFDNRVNALAPISDTNGEDAVAVFMSGRIGYIAGSLRNSMSSGKLEEFHGARSQRVVSSLGNDVVWLDTSSQIRMARQGEISLHIRPDIAPIDHLRAYVIPYAGDTFHWICVLDSIRHLLYVYDIDTRQWMPPWSVDTYVIATGEIAAGQRVLVAALGGTLYCLKAGTYTDKDQPYDAFAVTSGIPITAESQPDVEMSLDSVTMQYAGQKFTDLQVLINDDPGKAQDGDFDSILNNFDPGMRRPQGKVIKKERYTVDTDPAEMVSIKMVWEAQPKNFEVYTLNLETHPIEEAGD